MHENLIISLGVGQWYPRGIARLRQSLIKTGFTQDAWLFDTYPEGCPRHDQAPYAFKYSLVRDAMNQGYKNVLWVDSSVWAHRPIAPIFDAIQRNGCFFMQDGWNVGQWCSDAALPLLKIDREAAFGIPLLWSCSFGLNLDWEKSRDFLIQMMDLASAGAFAGSWTNKRSEVSEDVRVMGHRHDQTCASVVVDRLKMPTIPCGVSPVQKFSPSPPAEALMLANGM